MPHENSDYIASLRSRGYRVTPQRLIVLDAVCEIEKHATFGDIYARVKELDPTIDQSTIYRALDVLCEVGLVVASEIGDLGKVYKIAGESDHHHLVCLNCGQVIRVDVETFRPVQDLIEQLYGFKINADHLSFNGVCQQCREKSR